jgi:hypothetical protein
MFRLSPYFRPDPAAPLASLNRGEMRARRGRLIVFFGMCLSAGKMYAMLKVARQKRRFMLRLLGAAALLWLVLMTALFLRAAG